MTAVLYGNPVSQPSRSCQWFLDFTGNRRVKVVAVNAFKGEHKKPEFVAKFPNGQLPSFEEDGFYLAESMAILKYLARSDPRFTPKDLQQQARLDEYLGQHYSTVRKFTTEFFRHFILGTPEGLQPGYESIKKTLQKYDATLSTQPYIIGHSLTLADFLFAPEVDQIQIIGDQFLAPFPNIRTYLARLNRDVAGYQKCFGDMRNAIAGLQAQIKAQKK
eukprot:TRINITY_DN36694_c0_g1_i1.p1 TRINITY_DN36694_c0_g1~~TRINITY_DN36694_c0_g1_i1.p1  ORF type:complete len:218 (+),score=26.38 TRINITY_DN36694_c0_g1_i1:57-710(+)